MTRARLAAVVLTAVAVLALIALARMPEACPDTGRATPCHTDGSRR